MTAKEDVEAEEVEGAWLTLLTQKEYVEGCLTLWYSLKLVKSRYPLIVMYTDKLDREALDALHDRGVQTKKVDHLDPEVGYYTEDIRFNECWTKIRAFSMFDIKKVVFLDSDMVVVKNMDELFDIPLDRNNRVYAASHACVCNPYKKPNYPDNWVPDNCAFSSHYYKPISDPSHLPDDMQHVYGPSCKTGLRKLNGGLIVLQPHHDTYQELLRKLNDKDAIRSYSFCDQDLVGDVFSGRWVPLSYKYNALKTLRKIHSDIWDDSEVKNIHYIISPKPWEFRTREDAIKSDTTGTFESYWDVYEKRLEFEKNELQLN